LRNQDREQDEHLRQQLRDKYTPVVDMLKSHSNGPFFLGEELSLAEIFAIPFVERFSIILKHYRDLDLLDIDPRLREWHEAATKREAFQKTTRPADFFISGYTKYANPSS